MELSKGILKIFLDNLKAINKGLQIINAITTNFYPILSKLICNKTFKLFVRGII